MKRTATTLCICLLAAVSCIYPYSPDVNQEIVSRLVVEGDILVGDVSTFSLSSTYSLDGKESYRDWDNSSLSVECSTGEVIDGVPASIVDNDSYKVDTREVSSEAKVRLHITLTKKGGRFNYYTSWLTPSSGSYMDSVTYSVASDKSNLSVLVSSHSDEPTTYYRWRYDEKYQYYSYYQSDLIFDEKENAYIDRPAEQQIHKCWKDGASSDIMLYSTESLGSSTIVDHEIFSISPYDFKISSVLRITLYQSVMSREAYLYYRSMKSNSDDVGGLFSPQPGEYNGNIYCEENPDEPVVGYVDATRVTCRTIYINNGRINYYRGRSTCPETEVDEGGNGLTYYLQGMIPVMYVDDDESAPYWTWGTVQCTDCRARGGVNVKPDDWEL